MNMLPGKSNLVAKQNVDTRDITGPDFGSVPYVADALHYSFTPAIYGELKDRTGLSDRDSVMTKKIVGDGSTYVQVDSFTDVDLPDNFTIEIDGKYISTGGAFGFDAGGADRFYANITGSNLLKYGIWDWNPDGINTLAPNSQYSIRMTYNNGDGDIYLNGELDAQTTGIIRTNSNGPLQLLTIGALAGVSSNEIYFIRITNNDTNEVILEFTAEEITDITNQTSIVSTDGQHIAQFFLTSPDTIQDDYRALSVCDKYGYTLARALGKNLFNKSLSEDGIRFLDVDTGTTTVSATSAISDYMLISPSTEYTWSQSTSGTIRVVFYDEYKNVLSGGVEQTGTSVAFTTLASAKYVRVSSNPSTDKSTWQLELGDTPTTYEAWQGIYKDSGATTPYADGQPISAKLINGTYSKLYCKGYDSEGNPYPLINPGRIKHQVRVVDGVVDNGVDYGNWSPNVGDEDYVTINSNGIELESDGTNFIQVNFLNISDLLKASTEYLVVIDVSENTLDSTGIFFGTSVFDTSFSMPVGTTGEFRAVRTTLAVMGSDIQGFIRPTNSAGVKIKYKIRFYESSQFTDPLIDPLPTSGQPVSGNSIILKEQYPLIQQADTNDILTTGTGDVKDNRVRAVDDIANNEYNQLYCQKDDGGDIRKLLFYDEARTSKENDRIELWLGF